MASPKSIADDIVAARNGSADALGALLDHCRDYLLLVANSTLDDALRAKIGASDVVQETFLDAHRAFGQFNGSTEQELLTWLRQMLLNNLRDAARRYQASKRNPTHDVALAFGQFAAMSATWSSDDASPTRLAIDAENRERIRRALERLAPDHRQVVTLRSLELRPFEDIGQAMDRSPDAARKLWSRAIQELARVLEADA
jgi:RNA polymerase sigma-70 factor (ECF subfamily)